MAYFRVFSSEAEERELSMTITIEATCLPGISKQFHVCKYAKASIFTNLLTICIDSTHVVESIYTLESMLKLNSRFLQTLNVFRSTWRAVY